jgi:DNA-binding transcriptional MocR family regulator
MSCSAEDRSPPRTQPSWTCLLSASTAAPRGPRSFDPGKNAGEFAPGERLPSVAALASEYQAGHGTIRRALGRLQDEGWLTTLPRYVHLPVPPRPSCQGLIGTVVYPGDIWSALEAAEARRR